VNIGFHYRGVNTEFTALYGLLLLCNCHHTLMQLGDYFRSQLPGLYERVVG
jgi:hypothetical protein